MIVVTGASKGIGRAICEHLHERGHDVLGLARTVDTLPFSTVSCDVCDYEAIKNVAQTLRDKSRRVSGLINAAGIASMNLTLMTPPEVSEKLIKTNLLGTIFCCQLFAPLMIRHKQGVIINFSSIAVPLALKGEAIYAASKAGVEAFSRSFAREVAPLGVRVNCIAPGPIATDLVKGVGKEQLQAIIDQQLIPKQFTTADICNLSELLLDERATALTGQVFFVGGV